MGPGRNPPLFVHSSYRTGSTWLWSKLRSAPTTIAYYEVFNEVLAGMTPDLAKGITGSSWDSRHPPIAPYFLEFVPLLAAEGGIAGFDRRGALDGFIPRDGPDGALSAADKAYVEHLVSHASSKRRIPVLTCTRSLGRARALRRSVGGETILLVRNLFHQWASYNAQNEAGNPYFINTIQRWFEVAPHDAYLQTVARWFGVGAAPLSPSTTFQVFLLLHLYLYSIAYDAADLVVDLGEICVDDHARRRVEQRISGMVAHPIDLSDVTETCDFPGLELDAPRKVFDTIEQFTKLVPASSVSSEGVAFVNRAKEAALAQWERFEFFNRRSRVVLTGRIGAAAAELARLEGEIAALTSARASDQAEHAETVQKLIAVEERASQAEADLENLRASSVAAAEDWSQKLALAEHDGQALRASLEEMATERAAARARAEAFEAELTAAVSERDEAQASLAETRSKLEATFYRRARRRFLRTR